MSFRRAMTVQEKLADDFPAVASFRRVLCNNSWSAALAFARAGRSVESESAERQALAVYAKLAAGWVPLAR